MDKQCLPKTRYGGCPGAWHSPCPSLSCRYVRKGMPHSTIKLEKRTEILRKAYLSEKEDGNGENSKLVTLEEVQDIAASRGINIYVRSLGPFFRIICREKSQDGPVLAVTTGFIVPFLGLMHCDTLQIFTRGIKGDDGERLRGGLLGLGLLIGGATFAYGLASGCHKAEILAINDDDAWHERLVKYYSRFGFVPVVLVKGDKIRDLPHMLVWGGAGTRMDADIEKMLRKWTGAIRQARRPASIPNLQ